MKNTYQYIAKSNSTEGMIFDYKGTFRGAKMAAKRNAKESLPNNDYSSRWELYLNGILVGMGRLREIEMYED